MKKFFFSCALACFAMSMQAEDVITVVPFNVADATSAVKTVANAKVMLNFETYDEQVTQVQFNVRPGTADLAVKSIKVYTNDDTKLPLEMGEDWDNVDDEGNPGLIPTGGYSGQFTTKIDGDNLKVVFSQANIFPFQSGAGQFATLTVQAKKGTAPGVYPVYVTEVAVSGADGVTHFLPNSVFYVKVGEPTSSALAFDADMPTFVSGELQLPSFVNEALATEAAVKTLDLSAVTAVNGDFTYVAGRKVVAPTSVAASVKFDAPLAGTYGSFCAPVDVNVDCYTFTSCDGTTAVFTPATTAPANTPVLIDKAVKTAAQAARLTTVEGRQITAGYYVAADGSGMHSVKSTATIPALRGAWEDIVASSNLRIAIETPTGIQYIGTADEVFGNTYDLQGRQVQEAHNGVFVVNGKKQFVK